MKKRKLSIKLQIKILVCHFLGYLTAKTYIIRVSTLNFESLICGIKLYLASHVKMFAFHQNFVSYIESFPTYSFACTNSFSLKELLLQETWYIFKLSRETKLVTQFSFLVSFKSQDQLKQCQPKLINLSPSFN